MTQVEIGGEWSPHWQPLVDQFAASFNAGEEAAALAIVHKGERVVDVWAGSYRNRHMAIENAPWQADTLVNVFSASKGLVAIAAMQLVERGLLDLDTPIASLWPEFAANGKAAITPRMVLCHRSGVSAFNAPVPDAAIFDWTAICAHIAAATPWWEPNTEQGYSPFIYGWIMGEVIRRASGASSFADFFYENIAAPLQADVFFGVPDSRLQDIADTQPLRANANTPVAAADADSATLGKLIKSNPRGVTNRAFANPLSLMTSSNSAQWRGAVIPAAGGHTNARALATIYGSLASDTKVLLNPRSVEIMADLGSFAPDNTLGLPLKFGAGVMLAQSERADCRFGRAGFGHPGAGGSLGFADPSCGIGFGYVTARMGQSILIDPRASLLVDAAYRCL